MANHVSALKRARQTETRTEVNRANRSRVRSSLRSLREALAKGDVKAAQAQYRATVSALDKSVQKGVLHSNTVSRYKSRLNARLKTLATRQGIKRVVAADSIDAEARAAGSDPGCSVSGVKPAHGPLCSSGLSTGKSVSAMIAEPFAVGWMPSSWMVPGTWIRFL